MNRKQTERDVRQIFGVTITDIQYSVIKSVLNGQKVLHVAKTGAGKSLTFQYSATVLDGVTIVISPLRSLMRDQVNSMKRIGIPAATINSDNSPDENDSIIQQAIDGYINLLYMAPERLRTIQWMKQLMDRISFIAIDECHCVTTWSAFRPAYLEITDFIGRIKRDIPVLCTTATATDKVIADITSQILQKPKIIRGHLLRYDLNLNVIRVDSRAERLASLLQLVQNQHGTGIVYTPTRKLAEYYFQWLYFNGIESRFYHAGLPADHRTRIEQELLTGQVKAIVSTNALGMGLDADNIDWIIHSHITMTPLDYMQQTGRAARGRGNANIYLLWNPAKDKALPVYFIKKYGDNLEYHYKELNQMISYIMTDKCRMARLLYYLQSPIYRPCGCCDNCTGNHYQVNITPEISHQIKDFFSL